VKHPFVPKTAAFLAAVMLVSVPAAGAGELTDAAVQSYEEQLSYYQRKKDEALGEIESIRVSSTNTLAEIRKYDEAIRYNDELKKLEMAQLDSIEKQIDDAEKSIEEAEKKLDKQEKAFKKRMVASYMDEKIDFIELLLTSKSLTDFLTRIERISAVAKNDSRLMDEINASKNDLENEKIRLRDALEKQKEKVAQLEEIIADSEAFISAKEEYLRSLEENEAAWTAVYTANAEAEAKLNRELEEYLRELQRQQQSDFVGEYSSESRLGWPIDPNAYYFISSEQGWRTLDGVPDNHLGMDIACAAGTDILAANDGTVVKSEEHWSYGNYVLINHGGGISTLYAHMSECLVSVGETVRAGQLIGHCGLTGYTKGYHLHFEVRENGKVQNPRDYVILP